MSSIRRNKKKSPFWFLDLRFEGRRIQRSLDTTDKKEAQLRARILERELTKEKVVFHRVTIEEFSREHHIWSASQKAPMTVRNEGYLWKRFLKEMNQLGIRFCDEITPRITDVFFARIAPTMTTYAVSWYLRGLRAAFNQALRWGYITENHFRSVTIRKPEKPRPRILTLMEIQVLLKTVAQRRPKLLDLFRFYLLTGVRRAEALRLQWKDVNFDDGFLTVKSTKGAKRERIVPLFKDSLIGDARTILESRRHLPQPFSFKPDYITNEAIELGRFAGLSDFSLHDLRKTCGTYLSAAGYSDFFVQQILGHEDRETSRQSYIFMTSEMARNRQNIFQKALSKN